jgi:chromosome segregation ATPase
MSALDELEREREEARRKREEAEEAVERLRESLAPLKAEEARIEKTIKVYKGESLSKAKPKPQKAKSGVHWNVSEPILANIRGTAHRLAAESEDGKFSKKDLIKEAPHADMSVRNGIRQLREEEFLRAAGQADGLDMLALMDGGEQIREPDREQV